MRHRVYGRHLGRNKNERTALFKNLVQSLIISETIETTEGKAKAIKGLVDKLITQAKSPATRTLVSQFITNKSVSEKLIKDLVPRLKHKSSGYTSSVRVGRRLGDNSQIVRMSLLLTEESKPSENKAKATIPIKKGVSKRTEKSVKHVVKKK